jgi:hypothetical protein
MVIPTLSRDQVAAAFGCSHAELGRLLRERNAPLPVRREGATLWFADEIQDPALGSRVAGLLQRRRQPRPA